MGSAGGNAGLTKTGDMARIHAQTACLSGRSPQRKIPSNRTIRGADGTPNGSRTRVSAVRGRHPWPLDDGSQIKFSKWMGH